MSLADERLSAARAAIARACLDALPSAQLGDITLRPEQRRIVARAGRALRERGGCLVGEDVGRGKTFIALALARRWRNPLIVAPAALRSTWAAAQARAGVEYQYVSHDSLSRRRAFPMDFEALVVDESHHFRNPATARYEELSRMAATVPIVLLSATPLQNRARDLAAQVALFHGERAFALTGHALARFVVRSGNEEHGAMPDVAPPEWLPVDADDGTVLDALLSLPSPPRPLDGGDAGALRTLALVRAWASSRAALSSMLRSRRRVVTAIAQGLDAGRTPTRRETRAWRSGENVVQLGFAAVLLGHAADAESLAVLREQVDDEDAAHQRVRSLLATTTDPDRSRVAAIRALRTSHSGCRIVAFSEYASTVSAFFKALHDDAGVGLLTARHARIASGMISRDEMLARFAPRAQGARAFAPHDAVTLLLATDLISEGVNLQDASIVLHLDLPWNPARLAQRVGRVRRPGGASVVRSFLLAPPAQAGAVLAAEQRLRRKLDQARVVIGSGLAVLPSPTAATVVAQPPHSAPDDAIAEGRLVSALERWAVETRCSDAPRTLEIGAVADAPQGWLAALDDGRLIASLGAMPTESLDVVVGLMENATREARHATIDAAASPREALAAWLGTERLLMECGVGDQKGALHRRAHALLASIVLAARRHEQAVVIALAGRMKRHLASPMPLGAERAVVRRLEVAASHSACAAGAMREALDGLDAGVGSRALDVSISRAAHPVAMILFGPHNSGNAQA